jgi:hypothetical protein
MKLKHITSLGTFACTGNFLKGHTVFVKVQKPAYVICSNDTPGRGASLNALLMLKVETCHICLKGIQILSVHNTMAIYLPLKTITRNKPL